MRDIEQLRRDLEEAVAGLSPAARRVWEAVQEREKRMTAGEDVEFEMPPGHDALLPSERDDLLRALRASAEVHAANAEENAGMSALMRQAAGVIRRAQELEPGLGDEITLGEAMAILERHGESSGLSPELADMVVEVPETRMVPTFYPDFTDADKFRRWDGSEQAEAWARLMDYRDKCIAASVGELAGTGIENIDYAGVIALLWAIGEDEAEEIVRRRQQGL